MINVVIKPDVIELPAGAIVRVPGTWQDYQVLAEQLGDHTSPRIKYRNGELLLIVPLPEHGKQLDIVMDTVKVLLRYQGLRFDSYHKTTIASPGQSGTGQSGTGQSGTGQSGTGQSGIIPDHFFYIGELPVVDKRRIDWETDPPPDLAIECDVNYFEKNWAQ